MAGLLLTKATKRLTKELQEFKANPVSGIRIQPTDNLFVWNVHIKGPADTPYEGGNFHFTFTFYEGYPDRPPMVKCETKLFHCNINLLGHVCLNLLKEDWTPIMTGASVARALQDLLGEPNPESPLDPDVGEMFVANKKEYMRRARLFTKKYAM